MNEQRIDRIRTRLIATLKPIELEVTDESHHHIGHEGRKIPAKDISIYESSLNDSMT